MVFSATVSGFAGSEFRCVVVLRLLLWDELLAIVWPLVGLGGFLEPALAVLTPGCVKSGAMCEEGSLGGERVFRFRLEFITPVMYVLGASASRLSI